MGEELRRKNELEELLKAREE